MPSKNRRSSARRARRQSPLRHAALGFEQLESRIVLNAEPVLSIEAGQFFAEDSMTPFRATFTDVREAVNQSFDYTINWGDGEETIGNTTQFRTQLGPFGLLEPAPVGNPISGLIEVGHAYADAGEYTVTVTLTDGLGGLGDTAVTQVNVYPVDGGVIFSGDPNTFEGTPYTISLDPDFFDPQIVENIESYTINWGDSMEVIPGSSTSAVHTYADDDTLHLSPGVHQITVAATGSNGTFFGFGGNVVVEDIDLVSSIDGATDVNEGDTYTLNLSAFDPGDPVIGWLIVWGDEVAPDSLDDFTLLTGNPSSATHVYADGDAVYTIQAIALTDSETHIHSHLLTVHNVAPTADAGGPYSTTDDTPITLNGSGFDAPGDLADLVFEWDFDGNLSTIEATGANPTFDPVALGLSPGQTVNVTLRVTDGDGGEALDTTQVTIIGVGAFLIDGTLHVIGSEAGNSVVINGQGGNIRVMASFISGAATFSASSVVDIHVSAGDGNDVVVVASNITVPTVIDG
ncbi:MAG: LEPR-XLL domain-containing protein, partial [Pirellulales bacterium]